MRPTACPARSTPATTTPLPSGVGHGSKTKSAEPSSRRSVDPSIEARRPHLAPRRRRTRCGCRRADRCGAAAVRSGTVSRQLPHASGRHRLHPQVAVDADVHDRRTVRGPAPTTATETATGSRRRVRGQLTNGRAVEHRGSSTQPNRPTAIAYTTHRPSGLSCGSVRSRETMHRSTGIAMRGLYPR